MQCETSPIHDQVLAPIVAFSDKLSGFSMAQSNGLCGQRSVLVGVVPHWDIRTASCRHDILISQTSVQRKSISREPYPKSFVLQSPEWPHDFHLHIARFFEFQKPRSTVYLYHTVRDDHLEERSPIHQAIPGQAMPRVVKKSTCNPFFFAGVTKERNPPLCSGRNVYAKHRLVCLNIKRVFSHRGSPHLFDERYGRSEIPINQNEHSNGTLLGALRNSCG